MLESDSMPYFDALLRYVKTGLTTFHCPGHQGGSGTPQYFREFMQNYALAGDITQVLDMDDVHQPSSIIKAAQELAAQAYDADASFFLVNGSTSGNHIMMMSVCNPGDKIIIPRNAHKSTVGALIFSGALPIYIAPPFDMNMQVDHTLEPEALEQALLDHPDAKAVMVLSPTYYGACADLKAIAAIVHSHGKPLLVDEAWGPHLHFHPDLPFSAMEAGADFCVTSTHKLLAGLSQASMLHLKGDLVDKGRVTAVLRLCLTTSPNSLLLASLDAARLQMVTEGKRLLTQTLDIAKYGRNAIRGIEGLWAYGDELVGNPGIGDYDLTRLVFTGKALGFTGYQIEKWLRYEYGIQVEMSDIFNVVALITIGATQDDIEKLVLALKAIVNTKKGHGDLPRLNALLVKRTEIELPDWPPQRLTPRQAFFAPFEKVNFSESSGRICSEVITPYPPGIPIVCPGEEITEDIINHMNIELQAGVRIQGPADPTLKTVRVVRDNNKD